MLGILGPSDEGAGGWRCPSAAGPRLLEVTAASTFYLASTLVQPIGVALFGAIAPKERKHVLSDARHGLEPTVAKGSRGVRTEAFGKLS